MEIVEGIVLRQVNYGESDRILSVFTRECGRIDGKARAVRKSAKRFAGRMDIFSQVRLTLDRRRGRINFKEAQLLEGWMGIRADLLRLSWAAAMGELVLALYGENEPHPRAYELLLLTLHLLDGEAEPTLGTLCILELRFLEEAGLLPQLGACIQCGEGVSAARRFLFWPELGGLVCAPCRPQAGGMEIPLGTLKGVTLGLRFPINRLARLHLDTHGLEHLRVAVTRFLAFHLGRELKARHFLEGILVGGQK